MKHLSSSPNSKMIVVTGIGLISPRAMSVEEAIANLADTSVPDSDAPIRPLERFEPEQFLGKRGFKYLSPVARYAVASAGLALQDAQLDAEGYSAEEKGVFAGTNCGPHEILDKLDHTILTESAEFLQPMEAPNFSVNLAVSHISIRYQFKAFNVTLTNMLVAGLEAIIFGAHSIGKGRARLVLAGAAEGRPPERLTSLLGKPLAEGASCLMALESLADAQRRGARCYARYGGGVLCFIPPDMAGPESDAAIADLLRSHVRRLIPREGEPVRLAWLNADFALNHRVNQAIRTILEESGCEVVPIRPSGIPVEEIAVSPVLALAGVAASHSEGLVVAVSPQGQVAMVRFEELA